MSKLLQLAGRGQSQGLFRGLLGVSSKNVSSREAFDVDLGSLVAALMYRGPVVVLHGAPGSGKGTHSSAFAEELGWLHLSTGDVFRNMRAKQVRKI